MPGPTSTSHPHSAPASRSWTWRTSAPRTDMATILILYAIFLLVGLYASSKDRGRTPADFIVAGRALPLWLATVTMTATWVDGGYLLGTAEGVSRSSAATSTCTTRFEATAAIGSSR